MFFHGQSGGGEHLAHGHIVGVGDGPESRKAVADCQQRQSLQKQRAQAMPMKPIVYGQSYFGLVRGPGHDRTREGDDTEGAILPGEGQSR
jgi:hypothetical protein